MIKYVRNLVLIVAGYWVVTIFMGLITGTDSSTLLLKTVVPAAIVIGGALYAVVGAMNLIRGGGAKED